MIILHFLPVRKKMPIFLPFHKLGRIKGSFPFVVYQLYAPDYGYVRCEHLLIVKHINYCTMYSSYNLINLFRTMHMMPHKCRHILSGSMGLNQIWFKIYFLLTLLSKIYNSFRETFEMGSFQMCVAISCII